MNCVPCQVKLEEEIQANERAQQLTLQELLDMPLESLSREQLVKIAKEERRLLHILKRKDVRRSAKKQKLESEATR